MDESEYVAAYAFAAQHADEISFKVGDVIIVTNKVDGGWWEGYLEAEGPAAAGGWFPCSHVLPRGEAQSTSSNASRSNPSLLRARDKTASVLIYRGFILKELLDFERTYGEMLTSIKGRLFKPLSKSPLLSESDRDLLIKPLQTLQSLQVELLRELSPVATAIDDRDHQACVGQIYVRFAPRIFEAYCRYAAKAPMINFRMNELTAMSEFQALLEQNSGQPSLQEAQQMPLDHIERYSVLLAELERHTAADHQDMPGLQIASACYAQIAQVPKDIYFNKLAETAMAHANIADWYGPPLRELGQLQFTGKVAELSPYGDITQGVMLLFPDRLVLLATDSRRSTAITSQRPNDARQTLRLSTSLNSLQLSGLPLQPTVLVLNAPERGGGGRMTFRLQLQRAEEVQAWTAAILRRARCGAGFDGQADAGSGQSQSGAAKNTGGSEGGGPTGSSLRWTAGALNPFTPEGRNVLQGEPVAADDDGERRRRRFGRPAKGSEPVAMVTATNDHDGYGTAPRNLPPMISEFDVISSFAKTRPAVPLRAVIKDDSPASSIAAGSGKDSSSAATPASSAGAANAAVTTSGTASAFGAGGRTGSFSGGASGGSSSGGGGGGVLGALTKRKTVKVPRTALEEQNQRIETLESRLQALQTEMAAVIALTKTPPVKAASK